jgi:glycine cleavage system H protein
METKNLELRVDKFTFRFPLDMYYSEAGVWAKLEGSRVRIGLSDFMQQRNGDVAFVEVKETGTAVREGEEVAAVETIKVNLSISSPIDGIIVEVNRIFEASPELVNLDPYGRGWLAVLEPTDWKADRHGLMTAEDYCEFVRSQSEKELRK